MLLRKGNRKFNNSIVFYGLSFNLSIADSIYADSHIALDIIILKTIIIALWLIGDHRDWVVEIFFPTLEKMQQAKDRELEPLGPRKPSTSPRATENEISRTATVEPYLLVSRSTWIMGAGN